MTRYTKNAHGHYLIHGHKYEILEGSRAQVMHGTAYKTSGGLKKHELLQNKNGRIVSRKKHATAKKERRLVKAGYGTKKGHFGAVKLNGKSKKMRGGHDSIRLNYSPEHLSQKAGRRRKKGGADAVVAPATGTSVSDLLKSIPGISSSSSASPPASPTASPTASASAQKAGRRRRRRGSR